MDADATARLGQWFAARLRAGDCLLLEGQIGAGKSHFARAFIQARLGRAEDVPSPTFTLVQSYQADLEIWHADLYRLHHPDEVLELGLDEAFDTAICLIEWPDRLGSLLPKGAMRLRFALKGEGRQVTFLPGQRADLAGDLAKDWAEYD
jgi:tRNA threonylcarbamoyladenosine biosynthesis protein TsaE